MNALAKRWLRLLRGGKMVQGQGALRNNEDKFCCLGVLCEAAGIAASPGTFNNLYVYDNNTFGVPKSLMHNVGLTRRDADILVHLNDTDKLTFAEIADELELRFAMDAPPTDWEDTP